MATTIRRDELRLLTRKHSKVARMIHPVYRCKAANMVVNQRLEVKVLIQMPEKAEKGVIYPMLEADKQENAIYEFQFFEMRWRN